MDLWQEFRYKKMRTNATRQVCTIYGTLADFCLPSNLVSPPGNGQSIAIKHCFTMNSLPLPPKFLQLLYFCTERPASPPGFMDIANSIIPRHWTENWLASFSFGPQLFLRHISASCASLPYFISKDTSYNKYYFKNFLNTGCLQRTNTTQDLCC